MESLGNDRRVFILGCNGCAQSSGSGGPVQVAEMAGVLAGAGKSVSGTMVVDFLCQKALVSSRLRARQAELGQTDSILVLTCGIGVQSVAAVAPLVCHSGCDTIYMGGSRGEWPADERCVECGQCLLDLTGGICPLVVCSKSLVNGACGGASAGHCELDKEKDCGWELIYRRLAAQGRTDILRRSVKPMDFNRRMTYGAAVKSGQWSIENREQRP